MPLYSEHISNMYYGGSPSYSAPYSYTSSVSPSYSAYLNSGGAYSNHSSLGGYSRPLSSRWVPSSARNYSPILSTISERSTSSPSRLMSPRRIQLSKRTYHTPSSYTPRPININTADIDVSRDRYRPKAPSPPHVSAQRQTPSPEKDNGPYMPRVDGKPETGIDSSPGIQRSTIKRGRAVVRLTTIKRKEKDSPRKPQTDDSQSQQEAIDVNVDVSDNGVENILKDEPTESVRWREKLSDDLTYKDKRQKKTLGAKLVEKFIVKDKDSDSDGSIKEKSRKFNVVTDQQEKSSPTNTSPINQTPDRRCSIEMLAEQASLLDSLIRGENLSTATLDLSKVGIEEEKNNVEPLQSNKRRKSNDNDNPLKTTKSDQSLHESLKSFNDPKRVSKKRSLRKSSSGGSIGRLDSITEFPKDPLFTDLPPIEESRLSIKRESIKSKPKPKLKAKITSSVEVSEPISPLKFIVENVTVEENPRVQKKEITYSAVVLDVLPAVPQSQSTAKEESAPITPRKNMRYDNKKRTKTLVREDNVPESPEPDDGNFWDKIGKRETVYLLKRKQFLENNRAQNRRAMFWFPEDEESGTNDETESNATKDLSIGSTKDEFKDTTDIFQSAQSSENVEMDSSNVNSSALKSSTQLKMQDQISTKNQDENEKCVANIPIPEEQKQIKETTVNVTKQSMPPDTNNEAITPDNTKLAQNKSIFEIIPKEYIKDMKQLDKSISEQEDCYRTKKKSLTPDKTEESNDEPKESEKNYTEKCQKDSEKTKNKTYVKSSENSSNTKGEEKPSTLSEVEIKELDQNRKDSDKSKNNLTCSDKTLANEPKLAGKLKIFEGSNANKELNKSEDLYVSEKVIIITQKFDESKEKEDKKVLDIAKNAEVSNNEKIDKKTNTLLLANVLKVEKKAEELKIPLTVPEKRITEQIENLFRDKNDIVKTTDLVNSSTKDNTKTPSQKKPDAQTEVVKIPPGTSSSKDDTNTSSLKKLDAQTKVVTIPPVISCTKDDTTTSSLKKSDAQTKVVKITTITSSTKDDTKTPSQKKLDAQNNVIELPPVTSCTKDDKNTPSQKKCDDKVTVADLPLVNASTKNETKTLSSQKIAAASSSNLQPRSEEKDTTSEKQKDQPVNNIETNAKETNKNVTSNVPDIALVVESENIPNKGIEDENETSNQEELKTGEDKKAENISPEEKKQEDVKQTSPKEVIKPAPRRPVKEEAAARPLIATPRPLQKKTPQIIHSSSSSETSSEEDSSDDEDADESDTSEGSTEFFECENNPDGRTSTGSNDSGFDSSAPNSPAGFLQIKKDCDVNCHRKCEKLTANLCGVNQRLLVEALASRSSSKKGGESAGTSGTAPAQPDATDISEQELEQSTAYGIFRKTGRFTPPARSIPRFRKYTVEDFQFIKVLGKGSFGKVLLAELRDTEYYYAVKCLKKDVVLEDDDVECTLIERKVLALGTNHPYLCHLFATFQTDSHLFFVMEYLNGGDLMFHIQQSGRFPEARARFYAAEIVSGLKFLHKRGIVYRDLKLDNILLDFEGHVRIADFGMCKLQIYLDKTADTFCGTPDYMAPEIIKGQKYNQTVDWWSFGVLLYEMLIGQSPFSGCDEDELFWSICNEMPSYPRFLSQDALVMLTRLLDKDARTRLGGTDCMHGDVRDQNFFHPIHWDKLERKELETPFKPRVRHPMDTQYFDRTFTGERPRLTAVEPTVLRSMDQEPFRGFSYTNPNATDR